LWTGRQPSVKQSGDDLKEAKKTAHPQRRDGE
jgi:hypothetical protein